MFGFEVSLATFADGLLYCVTVLFVLVVLRLLVCCFLLSFVLDCFVYATYWFECVSLIDFVDFECCVWWVCWHLF